MHEMYCHSTIETAESTRESTGSTSQSYLLHVHHWRSPRDEEVGNIEQDTSRQQYIQEGLAESETLPRTTPTDRSYLQ
jgi:hypothetical protein